MSISITVMVGGLTLKDQEIEHAEVRQELGAHCTCSLSFDRNQDSSLKLQDLLGEPVTVVISGDLNVMGAQVSGPVFQGIVNGGMEHQHAMGHSAFSLSAVSYSIEHEYRDVDYFPKSDIQTIASYFGAKVVGPPPTTTGEKLEYVQYGESDFAFLVRAAEENGFFVRTSGKQTELHAEFESSGVVLLWGRNLSAIAGAAEVVNPGFRGAFYDPAGKTDARLLQVRKPANWLGGAQPLVSRVASLSEDFGGAGDPHVEEFTARAATAEAFRKVLERKSQRLLGNAVRVEGTSSHTGLQAGLKFRIENAPNVVRPTQFTGDFGATQVVHTWSGGEYQNRFVGTPWKDFSQRDRPPRRLLPGLVTAEVMKNEDPDKLGRIKVRYHWQDRSEMTRWVRMAMPHSGNGRGIMFLPEIGDEVLVGFEQGDPERPVVLGCLWNGKDVAPPHTPSNNHKRIITKSGNTIQLVDEPGKETIEIYSAQGTCFLQLSNAAGGKPLITIRSGGDISFEAEGEIRMKCKSLTQRVAQNAGRFVGQNDTVKAGQNAVIKAGMNANVEATNTTVSAGASLIVKGGATTSIAGAMVHIQPPGLAAAPAQAQEPAAPKSVWAEKPVPKAAEWKSVGPKMPARSEMRRG